MTAPAARTARTAVTAGTAGREAPGPWRIARAGPRPPVPTVRTRRAVRTVRVVPTAPTVRATRTVRTVRAVRAVRAGAHRTGAATGRGVRRRPRADERNRAGSAPRPKPVRARETHPAVAAAPFARVARRHPASGGRPRTAAAPHVPANGANARPTRLGGARCRAPKGNAGKRHGKQDRRQLGKQDRRQLGNQGRKQHAHRDGKRVASRHVHPDGNQDGKAVHAPRVAPGRPREPAGGAHPCRRTAPVRAPVRRRPTHVAGQAAQSGTVAPAASPRRSNSPAEDGS